MSAGIRARKSRTALSVSGSKNFIVGILDVTPKVGNLENSAELLHFSEVYETLLTDAQEVASLKGESSNQLFKTLEEWNDYLERYCVPINNRDQAPVLGRELSVHRN